MNELLKNDWEDFQKPVVEYTDIKMAFWLVQACGSNYARFHIPINLEEKILAQQREVIYEYRF